MTDESTSSSPPSFTKLGSSNYSIWKEEMKAFLGNKGLWTIVSGAEKHPVLILSVCALLLYCVVHLQWLLQLFPFQVDQVIDGFCITLFFLVCFVCIVEIFMPRVSSLQSLTLGTRSVFCSSSHNLVSDTGHKCASLWIIWTHSSTDSLMQPACAVVYIVLCNPALRGSPFELFLSLCSKLLSPIHPFPSEDHVCVCVCVCVLVLDILALGHHRGPLHSPCQDYGVNQLHRTPTTGYVGHACMYWKTHWAIADQAPHTDLWLGRAIIFKYSSTWLTHKPRLLSRHQTFLSGHEAPSH